MTVMISLDTLAVNLTVVASAQLVPWGERADGLPGAAPTELAPLAGFIESRFSPLVAAVVDRCLADIGGAVGGEASAILLGSTHGDATTTDLASEHLAAGWVRDPLLFHQSVPTAVLGHIARAYRIMGPLSCLSAHHGLSAQLLHSATLLLAEEHLEQVLVVGVELAPTARTARIQSDLASQGRPVTLPAGDVAVAALLRTATPGAPVARLARLAPEIRRVFGQLADLVALSASEPLSI